MTIPPIFTELAEADLIEIYTYSYQQWGEFQADKYINLLREGVNKLASSPRLGKQRAYIPAECIVYHIQRHLIIYRIHQDTIEVLRVLYDGMDIKKQFSQ